MIYKRWITVWDSNDWENEHPVLGIAEVRAYEPIPMVILGKRMDSNPWIVECMGLNDADNPNLPDSIGIFGFVHMWPAAKLITTQIESSYG